MSDVIHRTGRILQIGSQQRSAKPWPQFRIACELVRNGRIGELVHVKVGLLADPSGQDEPQMPVPENLNYDMWLGSTPKVYYTEKRVHPQNDYSRPGWLRCEQFGAGMAVSELLIQSVDDIIRINPALSPDTDARFTNLRTQGGFLVSAKISRGSVEQIEIQSLYGGPLQLSNPWSTVEARRDDEADYSIIEQDHRGVFNVSTRAGERWRFRSVGR